MHNNEKLKRRLYELENALEYTEQLKKQLKEVHEKLEQDYWKGKLSFIEFKAREQELLKGRDLQAWMLYLEECKDHYRKQHTHHKKQTAQKQPKGFMIPLAIILSIILVCTLILPTFTGFNILPTSEDMTENITSTAANTDTVSSDLLTSETTKEENITGGNETETTPPEEEVNQTNSTESNLEQSQANNSSQENNTVVTPEQNISETPANTTPLENETATIPEQNLSEVPTNISEPTNQTQAENYTIIAEVTTQAQARIGIPVTWVKQIKLDQETQNAEFTIPDNAEVTNIKEIVNNQEETVDESSIIINQSGTLTDLHGNELPSNALTGNVISETAQSPLKAYIQEIMRFLKELGQSFTGFAVENNPPENTTSIIVQQSVQEVVVEYTTEAPQLEAQATSNGEIVTIVSSIPYTNISTFTTIPETPRGKVELYNRDSGENIAFNESDTNNDGNIDYLEWTAPESGQSYQIILATGAEHLDTNRSFISDVYEQIKEQDNNWTEPIKEKEYVRVQFEKNLTNQNDITIYVRNKDQTPTTIDIYPKDSNELIGEYPIIMAEGYYKVYLTNLTKETDTFDLRIKNSQENASSFLEFDHIIDPTVVVQSTGGTADIAISPIDNTSYVVAWINLSSSQAMFAIQNTSGANIVNPTVIENGVDGTSRIALGMVNKTTFVVAWINQTANAEMRAMYTTTGTRLVAPATGDGAVGTINDLALTTIGGSRTFYCYVDSVEADADLRVYNTTDLSLIGAEVDIDANMKPPSGFTSENIFDCSGMNDTRVAMAWIKHGTLANFNVTFTIRAETGALPLGITDTILDANIGSGGEVALTGLRGRKTAVAWYNGNGTNISMEIINGDNIAVVGRTSVDTNVGNNTKIAITSLQNGTSKDYFAIAYFNQISNNITGVVYSDGGVKAAGPFTIESFPATNHSFRMMDLAGREFTSGTNQITDNPSICAGKWAIAYTNQSNATQVVMLDINGSTWNGSCANTAPTIDTFWINTTTTENYTDAYISVNYTVTDPDTGDTNNMTIIDWYVNNNYNSTFANLTQIQAGNTTKGDNFTVTVAAYDGKVWGINQTGTVIIRNAPPAVPHLNYPANGTNFSSIPVVEISNTSDLDGDKKNYSLLIDNNEDFSSPERVNLSIAETANTTKETSSFTLASGTYYWKVNASDGTNGSQYSSYFFFNYDKDAPTSTNTAVNRSSANIGDWLCINATVTDNFAGISTVWAQIANGSNQMANYTMTDTGPYCSGIAGDNRFGVEIHLTGSGNWTVNTTWANDTFGNEGRDNFVNLNVAVGSSESPPTITQVSLNDTRSITIGGTRVIELSAIINDTNGNINASSVIANISKSGQSTRSNSSCIRVSGDGTGANFTCTVGIEFYDAAGDWRVAVEAQDNASNFAINNSEYFTLQETIAMNMSSTSISFPGSTPGAKNITASTGAISVQNIGNKVYLNLSVTGINLLGDTNSATQISANNFTVSNQTGNNAECTNSSTMGARLLNNTVTNIEGANISRGAAEKNNLYFCITAVPLNVITQIYSTGGTPNEDDWTVTVT